MLKIKLFAVLAFSILAVIALSNSRNSVVSANEDIFQEVAKYKTWQRINKKPIKVLSGLRAGFEFESGGGNTFIVDGKEVTNFRTGSLNG